MSEFTVSIETKNGNEYEFEEQTDIARILKSLNEDKFLEMAALDQEEPDLYYIRVEEILCIKIEKTN